MSHFVRPGYGSRNDVFPIYIGDDQTDEDAFEVGIFCMWGKWVSSLVSIFCHFCSSIVWWELFWSRQAVVRKKHGLAILVSSVVKETNAVWSLKDPNEVKTFWGFSFDMVFANEVRKCIILFCCWWCRFSNSCKTLWNGSANVVVVVVAGTCKILFV